MEQTENKPDGAAGIPLDSDGLSVYTNTITMRTGRPPKPEHLKRTALFPIRLTPTEMAELERASRSLGEPVAAILRKGARLYIRRKGKGGSPKKGAEKR